jgi:hypothetical protein
MIPQHATAAAAREFPCSCSETFAARGRVDPTCRHDDLQRALEAAFAATVPPTCCLRCRRAWDQQVSADGAPPALVAAGPMFVCSTCGDKRCPAAADHRAACTA